jgi:hypothetical protein
MLLGLYALVLAALLFVMSDIGEGVAGCFGVVSDSGAGSEVAQPDAGPETPRVPRVRVAPSE